MTIHKAVIPAAGLGTRFLPATKSTPKEMLPVVDKPAIQYVVEEAVKAGLDDVLLITGRSKRTLADHFDAVPELEAALEAKGDLERLAKVRESTELGHVHFVRQGQPKGLGHAVLQAKHHVGQEPFAVLLGDDLIDERDELLSTMLALQERTGGSVIALLEVPPAQISMYGCAAVEPFDGAADPDQVRITALVEKPPADEAPSNLAIIGRYVLHPAVFEVLENTAARPWRRDPADRRARDPRRPAGVRGRRRVRRGVPRASLRHRGPPRLPQGRRPDRGRPARSRPRLPCLVGRVLARPRPTDLPGGAECPHEIGPGSPRGRAGRRRTGRTARRRPA